jgi:hypothetical protein
VFLFFFIVTPPSSSLSLSSSFAAAARVKDEKPPFIRLDVMNVERKSENNSPELPPPLLRSLKLLNEE